MNRTGIEYLDYSWNPLAMHCTPVSEGCAHCWHLTMTKRLAGNMAISAEARAAYAGDAPPLLIEERLAEPLSLQKGARIGVQFMGDLFHENVPFMDIADVFQTMLVCPSHTFMVLTKRAVRMREYMEFHADFFRERPDLPDNVYLGVTVENQEQADKRIPVLLETPAAVRFISYEPALGPLDIVRYIQCPFCARPDSWDSSTLSCNCGRLLDLVICGAETGPGARPMDLDWARDLRDQCVMAGVPFFFKRDSDGNRELDGRLWEEMP